MILVYIEDYFNIYLQMCNSILSVNKNINLNKTPIWIEECVNKKLKKNKFKNDYLKLSYKMKFKIIYRTCKFIEMIEIIKETPACDICSLFDKIQFNWTVFSFSHFLFLMELSFSCVCFKQLVFSLSMYVISFLSINYYNKRAFLIVNKIFPNEISRRRKNLIINLKKFDIFFYSENYSKITPFINELQLLHLRGFLTHKTAYKVVIRLGKFFMKKNDFKLAFSYFAENLLKASYTKKIKFYIFFEIFSFCAIFVKKYYLNSSLLKTRKFYWYSNFRTIKILSDNVQKMETTKIQKTIHQKTKNSKKKFLKINVFNFLNFFLLEFFENISTTYIRIDIKFISAMLGTKKTQTKKMVAMLNITQKKKCFLANFRIIIYFLKKKIRNFLTTLVKILIQLNTIMS
ncbi:hypothetical protein CPARA_2gp244 (nucleomorph) [Cryptomonas paramecium]|uniref:Uncharacterized protein n=1 Tax=Cryptomonas paramaecium TaxID=2898 RepID=F2HHV6_9CRYP|nr:hypothetical protein CPARA_2gp244 [Cryptomonas paramecium]AEA38902.1 hypothetical protein CPARA_2gp244 [Cryptomonas paramecium]